MVCGLVYAPLEVSPDEVGLGYGDLLARAGTLYIAVAAYGVLVVLPGIALGWALGMPDGRRWRMTVAAIVIAISFAALLATLPAFAVVTLPVGWLLTAFIIAVLLRARVPRPDHPERSLGVFSFVSGGVSVLVLAVVLTGMDAAFTSERLREGRPSKAMLDIPTPWTARVVRVHFTAEGGVPSSLQVPRCLLYLGRADGTSVFYDARPDHRRVLRLPTAALAVEVLPNARSALSPSDATTPEAERRASQSRA